MTQYVRSTNGTVHSIELLDHREGHAEAPCGYAGAPVELEDVEDTDKCGTCFDVDDVEEDSDNDVGE